MKELKITSDFFDQKVTYNYNKELDKLRGRILAPKKLEEANKLLRKLKTPLPK
ncbi:hypothetical protein [Niastella yeongjuensis]|uniref:hypothetical protein n=1 Tax=Niastella yeongjuensis TaxID=354355 RepID=UPI0013FDED43|nr:hypothetical protein [Niastella yeongjuensis]